jgi:hypothetical protein
MFECLKYFLFFFYREEYQAIGQGNHQSIEAIHYPNGYAVLDSLAEFERDLRGRIIWTVYGLDISALFAVGGADCFKHSNIARKSTVS